MAQEALRALREIAFRIKNDANGSAAEAVEAANVVDTVVSNAEQFGCHKELLIAGMQVLTGLAGKEWGGRLLQREGTPQAVAAVVMRGLYGGDKDMRLAVCRAVNALASRQSGYDVALGEAGACDELLRLIGEFGADADAWKVVADAMAAMARSHDGNRQAFRRRAGLVLAGELATAQPPVDMFVTGVLDSGKAYCEALSTLADHCVLNTAGFLFCREAVVEPLRTCAETGCCTCSLDTSLPCRFDRGENKQVMAAAVKAVVQVVQISAFDVSGGRTRVACLAMTQMATSCARMAEELVKRQAIDAAVNGLQACRLKVWGRHAYRRACQALAAMARWHSRSDLKATNRLANCGPALVAGLRAFCYDVTACQAACHAIVAIAARDFNRQTLPQLVELGVTQQVIATMRSFPEEEGVAAAGCYLVALLASQGATHHDLLRGAGASEAVVAAMRASPRSLYVSVVGCEAIGRLASEWWYIRDLVAVEAAEVVLATLKADFGADARYGRLAQAACFAIYHLGENSQPGQEALFQAGACAAVVEVMRKSLIRGPGYDVLELTSACQAAATLAAASEGHAKQLVAEGACEAVVEGLRAFLWPGSALLCRWACEALAALTRGRHEVKEAMGGRGPCGAVVEVLRLSRDDSGTCKAALKAVKALAEGLASNKSTMGAAGACEMVLAALRGSEDDADVGLAALEAVAALSEGMPSNQHAMRQAGACEVLVTTLQVLSRDAPPVRVAAVHAIAAVSDGLTANQNAMRRAGACEALVCFMRAYGRDREGDTASLAAICSLAASNLANQTALGQAGACEEVVGLGQTLGHNRAACLNYCKAVATLAEDNARNAALLGERDGYMTVLNIIRGYLMDRGVQAWGCLAMATLADRDMDNKAASISSGAAEEALAAMAIFPGDRLVCTHVCRVFYALAARGNVVFSLIPCQLVLQGVNNHTSDPDVCLWACRLITLLAGIERKGQQAMATAGACEYVPQVLARYRDSDRDVCDAACRALLSLARDSPANQAAMRAAGASETVVKVLRAAIAKGQRTLCLLGCDAVGALAAEGSEAQADLQFFGACEAVVEALRAFPREATVWQRACGAIAALANRHAACQEALGRAGACEAVAAALQGSLSAGDRLVSPACGGENQQKLEACELVVDPMTHFSGNKAVQYHASRAARALTTGHAGNRRALERAGAREVVKEALRLGDLQSKLCMALTVAVAAMTAAVLMATYWGGST